MYRNAANLPLEAKEFLAKWIGQSSQGFGGITHKELTGFFESECGLSPDHPGVRRRGNERKRDRFESAFSNGTSDEQHRILLAVLDRFPPGSAGNRDRQGEMQIEAWIGWLDKAAWYVRFGRWAKRRVRSAPVVGLLGLLLKVFS